jgi:hypothetical protein
MTLATLLSSLLDDPKRGSLSSLICGEASGGGRRCRNRAESEQHRARIAHPEAHSEPERGGGTEFARQKHCAPINKSYGIRNAVCRHAVSPEVVLQATRESPKRPIKRAHTDARARAQTDRPATLFVTTICEAKCDVFKALAYLSASVNRA